MTLIALSFIAGVLTIFAPCAFHLLPVILGGSVLDKRKARPYVIIAALAGSVLLFTVVLHLLSNIIFISEETRRLVAGGIIVTTGVFILFPKLWGQINVRLGLSKSSDELLGKSNAQSGWLGPILTGAALGPVFTTCSPTFGYVLGTVIGIQGDFAFGLANIVAYVFGLASILLLVALFGNALVAKFKWAANPSGTFHRVVAVIFIIVGLGLILRWDKALETAIISLPFFSNLDVTRLDLILLERVI